MTGFWPEPTARDRTAYADAVVRTYWFDRLPPRDPHPPLRGRVDADLCIVGGGFTGLWAALHAKADDPRATSWCSRRTRSASARAAATAASCSAH